MRKLLAILLAVAGLTACTGPPEPVDPVARAVPPIVVFLSDDATVAQRQGLEAELRALPDAGTLEFETKDQAYAKFKDLWKDNPDFIKSVAADALPASYKMIMKTRESFFRLRDGDFAERLKNDHPVQDVVFQCSTTPECEARQSRLSSPAAR